MFRENTRGQAIILSATAMSNQIFASSRLQDLSENKCQVFRTRKCQCLKARRWCEAVSARLTPALIRIVGKATALQYFGTLGSTRSAQALIPPARL